MMREKTGDTPALARDIVTGAEKTGWRYRRPAPARRPPHSLARLKKQYRQLQQKIAALEDTLKRQSADTYGLQSLYDNLVNEIKHHRDMLHLDSFDTEKSSAVYTQAWRRFMAGDALGFQTHRHTNSRSRLPLF
ncbi:MULTISPECIES: hypothetical protein [unclassified Janthinobacterium]|uniref:hypothetical protein n=1 Tax=unclassified Janthinobacterium TaxID=2610881 RepID=UPI0016153741|nr:MULTISPECIES: hypothetical protein [unclassified Janthinobacterium]MBB5369671.1 hypothetical protein [Janthinobacterium sp. K2C7]MBB5382373.1 hypothetical protein [Janthinobacterium sp. K2Li3]MBB5387950.1 hypothetical protein [Janthinobacterium sp. K2E3]